MTHILLIEDNLNNAEYIIRILEGAGYEVKHFVKGLDGARSARTNRPALILLDFNLPDVDGNVLIVTLKKSLGGDDAPPVVAVTARNGSVDRRMAQRFGFAAFIGKPFEPEELLGVVRELLSSQKTEEI